MWMTHRISNAASKRKWHVRNFSAIMGGLNKTTGTAFNNACMFT
jgi:hypothetical protein